MRKRKWNASIACYAAICEYRRAGRKHLSQESVKVLNMLKRRYS